MDIQILIVLIFKIDAWQTGCVKSHFLSREKFDTSSSCINVFRIIITLINVSETQEEETSFTFRDGKKTEICYY